eukprot:1153609-Pelagomonas_calceolata.AAC.4
MRRNRDEKKKEPDPQKNTPAGPQEPGPPAPACCWPPAPVQPAGPSLLRHTSARRPLLWHAAAAP